jgi:hypothetical protein
MSSEVSDSGKVFASQSFREPEVRLLDQILKTLIRGGDPHVLVRSASFPSLMRKVATMRTRIDHLRGLE